MPSMLVKPGVVLACSVLTKLLLFGAPPAFCYSRVRFSFNTSVAIAGFVRINPGILDDPAIITFPTEL